MFQDYENIPENLISESWISGNFFTLRDAVEKLGDTEQEAFFVWCNYKNHDLSEEDADDLIRDFWDEYQGQYDDEENFAYRIVEECYDLPEFARPISIMKSLPVICSCVIIGLMTALCSGQRERIIRAGCQSPAHQKDKVYNP